MFMKLEILKEPTHQNPTSVNKHKIQIEVVITAITFYLIFSF